MPEHPQLPVVVIGFGGHGRVVADALVASGRRLAAVTDLQPMQMRDDRLGVDILTDQELLERFRPAVIELALGIGSLQPVDAQSLRRCAVERFRRLGYRFTGVRHPAAWISPLATIAPTAQVHAGAIIQTGARVGEHCIINTRASVDHDGCIGDFSHIGPGVTLSGNVTVGQGSHLGTGCCVIQGVTLGERNFVAAGATVVSDVEADGSVRGTPARSFTPKFSI